MLKHMILPYQLRSNLSREDSEPDLLFTVASNVFVHHPVGGFGRHEYRADGVVVLARVVEEAAALACSSEVVDVPAAVLELPSPSMRP